MNKNQYSNLRLQIAMSCFGIINFYNGVEISDTSFIEGFIVSTLGIIMIAIFPIIDALKSRSK